jgi:hypothetical protein
MSHKVTVSELQAQLAEQRKQIDELRLQVSAPKKARAKKSQWFRVVNAKSPLRVIGVAASALGMDFVQRVNDLPIGESLAVPTADAAKLLNKSFPQSGFRGEWDAATRTMTYTHIGSKSGKTPANGAIIAVTVPVKGARTVTRLA